MSIAATEKYEIRIHSPEVVEEERPKNNEEDIIEDLDQEPIFKLI
jgi:hypothetical protein